MQTVLTPAKSKNENSEIKKQITKEIEEELNEIEQKWKMSYKFSEESKENITTNKEEIKQSKIIESTLKKSPTQEINDQAELLRKKFFISMDIHKKPTELTLLKQIFSFKRIDENTNENETVINKNEFLIEESYIKPLLFIEYIIQRLNDLLTENTKSFMFDSNYKQKINKQREEDEYSQKYDQIINEKAVLYNSNDKYTEKLILSEDKIINNSTSSFAVTKFNKLDQNSDNGEAEMEAKLKDFSHIIEKKNKTSDKTIESSFLNDLIDDDKTKRPVPDFTKLREEALKQQLKIKEFFDGCKPAKKDADDALATIIDLNEDENKGDDVYKQDIIFKIKQTDEEIVRVLPPLDSKSQVQIRRKIFFEKLIK
jgi:hypothetical protein